MTVAGFKVGLPVAPASNSTGSALTGSTRQPGQYASYGADATATLQTDDDLWLSVEWWGTGTPPTFDVPGWTLAASTSTARGTSTIVSQWWRGGIAGTTTWSTVAPTLTVSPAARWRATVFAVRGAISDGPRSEVVSQPPSPVAPSTAPTIARPSLAIGYMYGGFDSGGTELGPDFAAANGWSNLTGHETGGAPTVGYERLTTSVTPTLPTFTASGVDGGWIWRTLAIPLTPIRRGPHLGLYR